MTSRAPQRLPRLLRLARYTWLLALASILPFFAMPWLMQEHYGLLLQALQSRPDLRFFLSQTMPEDLPEAWASAPYVWGIILVLLATTVPRWVQARLRRSTTHGRHHPLECPRQTTYRELPETDRRLKIATTRLLAGAYYARAATMLILLTPLMVWSALEATVPIRWFACTEGNSGAHFGAPPEYLPALALAIIAILANAPSARSLLGRFAESHGRGLLSFEGR